MKYFNVICVFRKELINGQFQPVKDPLKYHNIAPEKQDKLNKFLNRQYPDVWYYNMYDSRSKKYIGRHYLITWDQLKQLQKK